MNLSQRMRAGPGPLVVVAAPLAAHSSPADG